ncbi:MAG TPA: MBOAT family O-acyltransferase [Gemmataceae bacterium]|nr:MBOAT family O-acyltransferase [Gemmataceae bacterium]
MNLLSKHFFVFLLVLASVVLTYYALRSRAHKYRFLLGVSWLFYVVLSPSPWFLGVILFTTVVDYFSGLLIESAATPGGKRRWLLLSVASNLGFLAAFKYSNFALHNGLSVARWLGWDVPDWTLQVVLPLGISFHTFQGISYTLDVYKGKIRAVRAFVDFALFVAFFPQLVAGPIVRAVEFLPQMAEPPRATSRQVVEGLHWFVVGLVKKAFLADWLARFVDPVFHDPSAYDALTLRWAVLAYAAQIYCDFSGYSDLAIGCAKWFGFELPQNFNFPYLSASIPEFWRRWHISLSTWMRDYVYISMGGNRRGSLRTYLNLLLTLTLCGLWHGASWSYVLWGFYNGVLLAVHRMYDHALGDRPWLLRLRSTWAFRLFAVLGTFVLVAGGFGILRTETWSACWTVERAWLGGAADGARHWLPAWVPLLVGMVVLGHLFSGLRERRCGLLDLPPLLRAAAYVAAVVLLVAFGPGVTKAFIYFQF